MFVKPHYEVSDSLDGLLHMGLLESLYIDVALQAFLGYHRLDLQRLSKNRENVFFTAENDLVILLKPSLFTIINTL